VSTTDGCRVGAAPELAGHTLKDLTTDARGQALWAITSAPGKKAYVWRRTAHAFERLAGLDDTNLMTIEVAPSLPSRVYVSGQPYTTIRGRIFRSDDGGATLRMDTGDPATLRADGPLFIGAVDPRDPARLLLRHLHAKGSDLYLSRDGGKSLANVLTMASAMFGFTATPDGKTIWAGSGLAEHGLFRSLDRGEHFESVSHHGVLCLHATSSDSLFTCENAATPGALAVAVATDGIGKTFTPLLRFADIQGPVECAVPDGAASLCADTWPQVEALFLPRAAADAGPGPTDAAHADAGALDGPRPRRGCGCGTIGAAGDVGGGGLVFGGMIMVHRRLRSKRPKAKTQALR
jgi:hypothetical protein